MGNATRRSRGFTLIASLLLLALLSGIAIGLMFLVNGSGRMGGNDMEANLAYYGAEAGMEKLTSDVLSMYQTKMSPTTTDFNNLASTSAPSSAQVGGMTYVESITSGGAPGVVTLTSGNYAGLQAQTVPITLQVSAIRPSGATVNMTRGVEVALIPVFQFGVFSDSDLSYFPGPQFGFKGRVHTNGNLFIAADSGPLIFGDKVTVVKEVIRDRLANNYSNSSDYTGKVYIPHSSGDCDTYIVNITVPSSTSNCLDFGPDSGNSTNDASWSGGIPTAGSANSAWNSGSNPISTGVFNSMITNGTSAGVQTLTLPFVTGATGSAQQIQIIRKPASTTESASSPVGSSREYTKATIRILLGDNCSELHPLGGACDGNDIHLDPNTNGPALCMGASGCGLGSTAVSHTSGASYFAMADTTAGDANWTTSNKPRCGNSAPGSSCTPYGSVTTWPLVRGWLRVEYIDTTSGNPVGVTSEWLGYGWARTLATRNSPGSDTAGHRNAILIFQQLADRNGDGSVSSTPSSNHENTSITGASNNFYPINFYDPREGWPHDAVPTGMSGSQCYANGIMNAVELDVANLEQWLKGAGDYSTGHGTSVNYTNQNGYLLYFSDRRGMQPDPNATPTANVTTGESGLEDVVNWNSATNTPDGTLDTHGYYGSAEDANQNGLLDAWGGKNIADGFSSTAAPSTGTNSYNPYVSVDCFNGGRQNWVAGARHVLKLIDGGSGDLPIRPDNNAGGFTVASENPVYVFGDYNTDRSDPFWGPPANLSASDPTGYAAAAVISDTVTLLSNSWSDLNSMLHPQNLGSRNASTTYYRMAIAAGKTLNFLRPTAGSPSPDFGTDGGVHNFLRYIENWGSATLHYRGSIVSLYYSQYNTGTFKCCTLVYSPPTRDYYFDQKFLIYGDLPPGTPMLQDIENLSYWQNFKPCTTQSGGSCTN